MRRCVAVLAAVLTTAPALGAFHVPGSWDTGQWDAASNQMTDNSDGTFTLNLSEQTANQRYEFKILDGDVWGSPEITGTNQWIFADAGGNVTITLNTNTPGDGALPTTNRVGHGAANLGGSAWTIVGLFQGWDNASAATTLVDQGNGVFKVTAIVATAATHEFKVTRTGSWADQFGANGWTNNSSTFEFVTTQANEPVEFIFNAPAGTLSATVVPEPASMALIGAGLVMMGLRRRKTA